MRETSMIKERRAVPIDAPPLRDGNPPRRQWTPRRPRFLPEGRRLPPDMWRQRHRGLTWLLWAHLPALYLFATIRGIGPVAAAAEASIVVLPAAIAMQSRLSRTVRSAATSVGLVIATSIFVHQAGGSIEAHFEFFVVLALLTLYQSWTPFLLALFYVVIEHGVIGVLDPAAVYNSPAEIHRPWVWAAIHGGFVLAASFANVLSWRLIEQEALHDALTGLPNRTFFLESLTKMLDGRGRLSTAVLFIDLDNFKDANDAFGHDIGDRLLQALSRRLRAGLRDTDVLARLGGDEFAIAITGLASRADARSAAERVLTTLSEPVKIGELSLASYASVGLAYAEADTESASDLLRNADLAMYEAKRGGGGRVSVYRPVLHTVALQRTELDVELRSALEREEFVVHYQPIYEVGSRQLVGTEALVRWQHPTRGLLAPSEFITAAEQSGIIVALGEWVLRTACRQAVEWQVCNPDRPPLAVSVNLSARQLVDRSLVTTVAEILHETGLEPASLCLEITESAVIKDFDAAMPTLLALRAMGISLALDDFGTGYSSLSYLKSLPVDSVKIDRSFVSELDDTHNSQIVLAIIELAHALGKSVTAEGAETEAQLSALGSMRSDRAQGYLLGRPVDGATLTQVIDQAGTQPTGAPSGEEFTNPAANRAGTPQ